MALHEILECSRSDMTSQVDISVKVGRHERAASVSVADVGDRKTTLLIAVAPLPLQHATQSARRETQKRDLFDWLDGINNCPHAYTYKTHIDVQCIEYVIADVKLKKLFSN